MAERHASIEESRRHFEAIARVIRAMHAALRYLREVVVTTSRTEDAREGVRAFFEKREPRWVGR